MIGQLPQTIKIGPFTYRVIKIDRFENDDAWGECDTSNFTLTFRRDHSSAVSALDTVIHEINHAIFRMAAIPTNAPEENVVAAMATGWTMVWADNPALVRWLARATKRR